MIRREGTTPGAGVHRGMTLGDSCNAWLLCKLVLCSVLLGSAWSLDNGLALTPVMGTIARTSGCAARRFCDLGDASSDLLSAAADAGWNTWDHFRCSGGGKGQGLGVPCNAAMDNCVSEVLIRQTADAIVERGLAERGYEYVNLWVLLIPSTPHSFRGRSRDTRSSC